MGKGALTVAAMATGLASAAYAYFLHNKSEAARTMKVHKLDLQPFFDWQGKLNGVHIGAPYGIVMDGNEVVRPGGVATFNVEGKDSFHPNQDETLMPITSFLRVCTKVSGVFNKEAHCIDFLRQAMYQWQKDEQKQFDFGHVSKLEKKPDTSSEDSQRDLFVEALGASLAHGFPIYGIYEYGPQHSKSGAACNGGMAIGYIQGKPNEIITPYGAFVSEKKESASEMLQNEVHKVRLEGTDFYSVVRGLFGRKMEAVTLKSDGTQYIDWKEKRNAILSLFNQKLKEKFKDGTKA